MKPNYKLLALAICLVFLLLPQVFAIGVMPAGKLLDYRPGQTSEFDVTLYYEHFEDVNLSVSAGEEFELSSSLVSFAADESSQRVSVSFTHPLGLEPGRHTFPLRITQASELDVMIGASMAIEFPVMIDVPYPGSYLEPSIYYDEGSGALVLAVSNKGEEVTDFLAKVLVRSENDVLVADEQSSSVAFEETQKLRFPTNLAPGRYQAAAIVSYNDQESYTSDEFVVGEQSFMLESLSWPEFTLGEVNKLEIELFNDWNEPVEAYADIVLSYGSDVIDLTTSPVSLFKSRSSNVLTAFLDTKGLDQDYYNVTIKVYSDQSTTEFSKELYFAHDAVYEEEVRDLRVDLVIIAVIVLVSVLAIIILYLKKRRT